MASRDGGAAHEALGLELQRRTERFVLRALEAIGHPARPVKFQGTGFAGFSDEDGAAGPVLFTVTLPPEVDPLGRYQEPRLIAFERDIADTWGADYVTLGSYLVDNLMDVARKRGRTANLFLPWFAAHELPEEWRVQVPGLHFANCRAEVVGREIVFHRFVLWDFRVTLMADERRDIPVSLLTDPLSEEVEVLEKPGAPGDDVLTGAGGNMTDAGAEVLKSASGWMDGKASGLLAWYDGRFTSARRPGGDYQLLRLYRRACQVLESVVRDEVGQFASQARLRLSAEAERLRAYYGELEKESLEELKRAVHRVASLGVRLELSRSSVHRERLASEMSAARREMDKAERSYRREVEAYAKELKRRLAELEEKYQPSVTATLVGAAYLFRPRIEYQLRLARIGGGSAKTPLASTIYFDLTDKKVVGLACPSCGRPLSDVCLDDAGELVCPDCVFSCAGCGQASTMPAQTRRCHLCGEEFCRDCLAECPAGHGKGGARYRVCRRCRDLWCESCLNLLIRTSGR